MRELEDIASVLEEADRLGADKDDPEGARFVQISDTLAQDIVRRLRSIPDDLAAQRENGVDRGMELCEQHYSSLVSGAIVMGAGILALGGIVITLIWAGMS